MSLFTGKLRSCGLAKESVLGTLVTPPTEFLRFIPPDGFYAKVEPLFSKAIGVLPDKNIKQTSGPANVTGMKLKIEVEGENVGNILCACFGLDVPAEVATFVVGSSNNKIDFKEDVGAQLTATLTNGTYAMGTSSAQAGTLCALIKTQMQAVGAGTYTVTYSYSTKKLTIAEGGSKTNVQILWSSGTNNANAAYAVLGFTKADTANSTSVTSNGTTTVAVFTHTYNRQAVAQLPTYSFWFDKGNKFPQFVGCMLDMLDIEIKAKQIVTADMTWTGMGYDDTGIAQAPVYSTVRPLVFSQAVVNVDGVGSVQYDNLKITMKNDVKADWALSGSSYPQNVYSEDFGVEISADFFFVDAVQYNKFLNQQTAHIQVILTSGDDIAGAAAGNKYSLTLDIPVIRYKTANLPIPGGVIKVAFAGEGVYDTVTSKTINAVLQNSVATTY